VYSMGVGIASVKQKGVLVCDLSVRYIIQV